MKPFTTLTLLSSLIATIFPLQRKRKPNGQTPNNDNRVDKILTYRIQEIEKTIQQGSPKHITKNAQKRGINIVIKRGEQPIRVSSNHTHTKPEK